MNLSPNVYAPFFEVYVSKALKKELGIIDTLQESLEDFTNLLTNLPQEKYLFAYAEEKWTLKELVSHIIDTERILAYRALRISRNDKADLLSFNENEFG